MPCRIPATTTLQFNFIYELLHCQRHTRKGVSPNLSHLLLSHSTGNSLGKHQRIFSLCFDICCPHIPQTLPVAPTSHLHKPAYVRQSVFFVRSNERFGSLLASSVEENYSGKTTGKAEARKGLEASWSPHIKCTPVKESVKCNQAPWNVKCFCEKMNLQFCRYMRMEQSHACNQHAVYPKSLTGKDPKLLERLLTWMRNVSIWLRVNLSVPVCIVCSQEEKSL